jgi:glycerol-3-phosphate dehydrogenase
LESLLVRGRNNGVEQLERVDRNFVRQREPHVRAVAALYSPQSGTVDATALVRALLLVATGGVIFLPASPVVSATTIRDAIELQTAQDNDHSTTGRQRRGLYADDVARLVGAEPFTIYPCRGEHAALAPARRHLANGLVYPLPQTHGLGIHALKTFNGEAWLGSDDSLSNR